MVMRFGDIIADYCIPLNFDGIEISIGYLQSELGFSNRQGSCADTNSTLSDSTSWFCIIYGIIALIPRHSAESEEDEQKIHRITN